MISLRGRERPGSPPDLFLKFKSPRANLAQVRECVSNQHLDTAVRVLRYGSVSRWIDVQNDTTRVAADDVSSQFAFAKGQIIDVACQANPNQLKRADLATDGTEIRDGPLLALDSFCSPDYEHCSIGRFLTQRCGAVHYCCRWPLR